MKHRINFHKNSKLHLCCDTDDLHPVMQNIFFDGGNAIASDGHVLIIAPIEEISNFSQDQKELLNGKFIHYSQYKKIIQFDFAEIKEDGIVCKTFFGHNENAILTETKYLFQKVEKYPNYRAIIPSEKEAVEYIGIRPNVLFNLSEAAGNKDMVFIFNSVNSAIMVKFGDSNIRGVIMPILVNSDYTPV